jgi:1-acyl-sn-glycerol-3-phosphate acyltransferase
MKLMDKRAETIANMMMAVSDGELNRKVEPDDPQVSLKERGELCEQAISERSTRNYRIKERFSHGLVRVLSSVIDSRTTIEGLERLDKVKGGAIITSNHFSPVDNTVVRKTVHAMGKDYLPIVCQDTNYAMKGAFGFLIRYSDTIPISPNRHYMEHHFEPLLKAEFDAGRFVLIYPEQEMWFNYRKPRPCKRGAYYYAAKFGVPVVSCFVEIHDRPGRTEPDFVHVGYSMHVLDPIFPDPSKSVRENSIEMRDRDYAQKRAAYERAYGKPLDDKVFSSDDVAGWIPEGQPLPDWAERVIDATFAAAGRSRKAAPAKGADAAQDVTPAQDGILAQGRALVQDGILGQGRALVQDGILGQDTPSKLKALPLQDATGEKKALPVQDAMEFLPTAAAEAADAIATAAEAATAAAASAAATTAAAATATAAAATAAAESLMTTNLREG